MTIENLYCSPRASERRRARPSRCASIFLALTFVTLQTSGEELPAEAHYYPSESLRLADELAPQLARALSSCDAKAAEDVRRRANEFMYRRWNWDEHIEKLEQYRVCFQMLSDIAATSRIVTDRNLAAGQYRFVAGMFDANYQDCSRLEMPTAATESSLKLQWPERFGKEPERNACFAPRQYPPRESTGWQ
jgi:hypothetical protein